MAGVEESSNVRVICRLRPVLRGGQVCCTALGSTGVEVLQQSKKTLERGKVKGEPPKITALGFTARAAKCYKHIVAHCSTVYVSRKQWAFDAVYAPDAATMDVYLTEVDSMVERVLELSGQTACILAFGQTGSGKTFTISGDAKNPGIMQLASIQITDAVDAYNDGCRSEYDKLSIIVSAGEVYQESLLDLGVDPATDDLLKPKRMTPATLKRVEVFSAGELITTLESMISRRAQGATNKNDYSSRSHAVYTITLERRGEPMVPLGVLGLCDLAGAEYAAATEGCDATRRVEGGKNNLGLMTLKAAFRYMSETAGGKSIPFSWHRSTLTRLLKPFLAEASGPKCDGSLLLLVTASVEQQDVEQTVQALTDSIALVGRKAAETEINLGGDGGVVCIGEGDVAGGVGAVAFRPASRLDRLARSKDTGVPKKAFVRAGSGIAAGAKGAAAMYGRVPSKVALR